MPLIFFYILHNLENFFQGETDREIIFIGSIGSSLRFCLCTQVNTLNDPKYVSPTLCHLDIPLEFKRQRSLGVVMVYFKPFVCFE